MLLASNLLERVLELYITQLVNVGKMLPHGVTCACYDATDDALVCDVLVCLQVNAHIVSVGEYFAAHWTRRGYRLLPPVTTVTAQQFIKYRMTT